MDYGFLCQIYVEQNSFKNVETTPMFPRRMILQNRTENKMRLNLWELLHS